MLWVLVPACSSEAARTSVAPHGTASTTVASTASAASSSTSELPEWFGLPWVGALSAHVAWLLAVEAHIASTRWHTSGTTSASAYPTTAKSVSVVVSPTLSNVIIVTSCRVNRATTTLVMLAFAI